MGLVDREGSKEWKDIIEKWLFPDLKSSDIPVPEAHYAIGTRTSLQASSAIA